MLPGKALFSYCSILICSLLLSCSQVPISGRRQLKLLPESQLESMAIGQYQQTLQKASIVRSGQDYRRMMRVGSRVKNAVLKYFSRYPNKASQDFSKLNWELTLIESDQVNAWAMPGGKIAFYTGIMELFDNDAQCAAVMAHEIAHVVASHGNERMSQGLLQQVGMASLAVALKDKPQQTRNLFLASYGLGTSVLGTLPFSRIQESEADELGLAFMARAGYDPRSAIQFWKKMKTVGGGARPPEFLSTHPAPDSRIKKLQQQLPGALKYYQK